MKVAFAGSFSSQLAEPVRRRVTVPIDIVTADEAEIAPLLGDIDVLVSMGFTAAMSAAAPKLRLVQVPGAGTDRVDRHALGPATLLANVYGHEAGIAEYVLGSMIAITRKFGHLDKEMRSGNWDSQWAVGRPIPPLFPELAGKTIAILGFGHIGNAVARRAAAFDMTVVAVRRSTEGARPGYVDRVETLDRLDHALADADFVVVTLPLTPETRGLVDTGRLARMRPTAYLVNVARGEIIDETALYDALESRRIAGAVIDVWYRYPTTAQPTMPATRPFHELDNVIMTPHVSGWTEGMLDARATVIARNIERIANGEPPENRIEV